MARNKICAPIRNGRLNIAGLNIKKIRMEKFPELSQNGLAALVQLEGIPMTKNTVQRMEAGEGTINDIQLTVFAKVLGVPVEELLDESIYSRQAHSNAGYIQDSDDTENLKIAEDSPDYRK